jgi:uncharacterized protein
MTTTRRFLWLGLLLLAGALPARAQPAVPALTGRVVDLADILSPATEKTLTALLAAHEDSTSNQVAVLTIPSLEGEAIEDYAIHVAQAWALGSATNDNGVLLLVAVEDREMRIEVGLGLEAVLTDVAASRIIRNDMVPYFRSGDFDEGVLVGAQRIVDVIEGTYTPSEASEEEMPPFWFGLIFILFPSLFAFFGVFAPGCARWFMFIFLIPFYWVGGMALTGSVNGGHVVAALYALVFIGLQFHPKVREVQKGNKAKIGPFTMSGGSSGGWSSGSGGWSSGGSSL